MSIKAAVIGDPISHSLSPKIHNFFLKKYDIKGNYEAIRVEKNDLRNAIKSMTTAGYAGFNVTIPHKEEIFKICEVKSEAAQITGAVNTVVILKDGKLSGHNSDIAGFLNNLSEHYPDFNLVGKNAFVIGAGGAARAIVYGLLQQGVNRIIITNRNLERAQNLIANFAKIAASKKCEISFLDKASFTKNLAISDLLVNSTALGMKGQEALNLDLSSLSPSSIVYDIVYKPLMTELLQHSKARGNKIVTGIGMLVHQALVGFELWFGIKPEIDPALYAELTETSNSV